MSPTAPKPNYLQLLTAPYLDGAHPDRAPFDVRSFSVREGVSGLFEVRLIALHPRASLDFDEIVGDVGHFFVAANATRDEAMSLDTTRVWSGVVSHLELTRALRDGEGLCTYEVTLVPRLWLLTQRRNYRMFQYKSAVDIAEALMGEWGIDFEIRLDRSQFKARKYKVQYAETDYEFFLRVLSEVGISFFFERVEGDTRVILTDGPERAKPLPGVFDFEDTPNMRSGKSWVTGVRKAKRVRPSTVIHRDRDYRKDSTFELQAQATVDKNSKLELFYYPENFNFVVSKDDGQSPSADDRGVARSDEREAARIAQIDLEARRGDAFTIELESNDTRVAVGSVLQIDNHPSADVNDPAGFLVVEARMSGRTDSPLRTEAVCVSTKRPYRPLPATKPRIIGLESGTVVGPPGEEIHCDEFGRVRVHFHWDRESRRSEASSCYIPVSQSWGGSGYGGMQLPRVGQEVLIEFLSGDPDRPIITGRVYTNTQKVPYKLPANKTQSGCKTNSTGGGGGFNEIMFEDKGGEELLRMQAERDKSVLVKRNCATNVGSHQSLSVGGNRGINVTRNESRAVGGNRTIVVGGGNGLKAKTDIGIESLTAGVSVTAPGAVILNSSKDSVGIVAKVGVAVGGEQIIQLTCGSSTIILTPCAIVIEGPQVAINPGQSVTQYVLENGSLPQEPIPPAEPKLPTGAEAPGDIFVPAKGRSMKEVMAEQERRYDQWKQRRAANWKQWEEYDKKKAAYDKIVNAP